MTSIFQKIESAVVTDVETAWADIEQFFTADVVPILKGVFTYIENNGQADLLLLGKAAFNSLISGGEAAIATGGNVGVVAADAVAAAVSTVVDQGKSFGLQIGEGAATLAVSMAAAEANSAVVPPAVAPPVPPAA